MAAGLFKVQHHAGRVLQVLPPQVGEATHGCAVDDAVIRRPAHIHDVSPDHLTAGVEPRKNLTETSRVRGLVSASAEELKGTDKRT